VSREVRHRDVVEEVRDLLQDLRGDDNIAWRLSWTANPDTLTPLEERHIQVEQIQAEYEGVLLSLVDEIEDWLRDYPADEEE